MTIMLKLPQMIGYTKYFKNNKTMSFKVIYKKLSKNYTKIWERVSSLMNVEFDSKPVLGDNDKYIKTKINSYGDKGEYKFSRQKSKKKKIKKINKFNKICYCIIFCLSRIHKYYRFNNV